MKQDTGKWRDILYAGSKETAWTPGREARLDRYDLATTLRVVRRMETSTARSAVFEEIKRKNPLYRLVDRAYSLAGAVKLQPFVLFAYMLKCAVSIGPLKDESAEAVAISNFANERHAVDRLAALVPDVRLLNLSVERRHMFQLGQLGAALRMLGAAWRIWPFLSKVARSHKFMPAARIASALAFYMVLVRLFEDRPGLNAAVVASNYSPEALGMAAAAHRAGRRVVYVNHAPIPANGALVPPVLADCAIFYGDAVRQTYERRSRCGAEVALIGQPWTARPMQWRDDVATVGIFLTALTKAEAVSDLVTAIRSSRPGVRVLIRNHPVALLKSDFTDLAAGDPNIEITIGNPLDEEIAACDLIVCGNSGVAMNALSGGRPVAYMDGLDGLDFDYNGFVESGLICHVPAWDDGIYGRLKSFYRDPDWRSVMCSYDAAYEDDKAVLNRAAAAMIRRHLSRKPVPVQAAFPAQLHAWRSFRESLYNA